MSSAALFQTLTSANIASFIASAERAVCYAGPGIQDDVATALAEVVGRVGPEMLTVCLDFDERVMRMGYGSLDAVRLLRERGVIVRSAPGLRMALVIVDEIGYLFTPTPLYLEASPTPSAASNAMRMSGAQVAEALARLSPAAKAIAMVQAATPEEKQHIAALPVDVGSEPVSKDAFAAVDTSLKEAPPVNFDVARQVRVFEPYLQYVELSLSGAAIQRHRLAIPKGIQALGSSKDIEGRLRTTFELIEKGGKLSSKPLEDALNEIRKSLTPSLGKDHGRVVLKAQKPLLIKRLNEFSDKLDQHQAEVSPPNRRRLPPRADRPPGTRISGRCPTGTSSASPSPTSSLISALPGNRHLLPQRVPPPLISRLPAAPAISSQTPPKARSDTSERSAPLSVEP
ncbi:hypothetical protein F2Q65_18405 [Thiohalocapsa marina]|uniref:Uncharacterized protein n=1 Tax=Thiohalocapsa marina TaxID=424902 RepID=A0A5M8FHY7_9GAMM|nr:hypothetical protein [Thiohalocapsa marina]KAA6182155.1 hypothetical protein F2Q65_18405 [Thiohalocapsa marina]